MAYLSLFLQAQSFLILVLLATGIYYRKNRAKHIKIMAGTLIWDFLLLIQVEVARGVLGTTTTVTANSVLTNIHITIAATTTILYILVIISGRKLLKGSHSFRPWHRRIGWTAFIFRVLTFATSFLASA